MKIDIEKLIKNSMTFDGYFVCYCLYENKKDLLIEYINEVGRIPSKVFNDLVLSGFITCESEVTFTVNNMSLTDKFEEEFVDKEPIITTFDKVFEEFKETYPNCVVGPTGEKRYLRQDKDRCERLYRNIIVKNGVVDKTKHDLIINCLKYIIENKRKARSLGYMKLMSTFLQQKEWEAVEEDVKQELTKGSIKQTNITNDENKTTLGSEEF